MADTATRTSRQRSTTLPPLPDTPPARAQARYVRVTPMKARRIVDLIRGQQADQALAVLRFAPQAAGEPVYKVLASAVANARYRAEQENRRLDVEDLVVQTAFVDEGPTLKRFRPRAQGRAFRVRKRSCHITVVVAPRDGEAPAELPQTRKRALKRGSARGGSDTTTKTAAKKAPAAKAADKGDAPAKKTTAKKSASKTSASETSTKKKATSSKAATKKADSATDSAEDSTSSKRRTR